MTAKPQPMAGQSDAADDLIAELAKLMAQDAQGERAPARPVFSLRIPGGDTQASPTTSVSPTADEFGRAPVAPLSVPTPAPTPAAPRAADSVETPEPFHFDFGLNTPKRAAVEPAPAPVSIPVPVQVTPAPAATAPTDVDHDSIADLIAAEFGQQVAADAPVEPPAPSVVAEPRQPSSNSAGWAPTAVAANLGTQEKPGRAPLRALNLQPAPKGEQDRFKVPPVFGLGSPTVATPAVAPVVTEPFFPSATPVEPTFPASQPSSSAAQDDGIGRDPIDEIESLIGRAMTVEFDRGDAQPAVDPRPTASSALRSLATPTIPSAPPLDTTPPRALSGADEAIFAAAQASGAQIGWVEAPEVDEVEPTAPTSRPRRRALGMTRAVAGPLVAVTLLLAAGFGLYWVLGLGGESGPAPLLTADASPVKETPAVQPDSDASQQSVVFNEIDGVVPGAEEQLLSRDQADVNEVTQIPPTELSEEGLANRKVRTVTVRPDGTIVSADDSVAGSAILPVARPNVPAVPGAETASPELLATTDTGATGATTTAATTTPAPEAPAAATVTPVVPGSIVPAVDLSGNLLPGKTAPVPMIRPAGLAALAAATQPTPVTAVVSTPVASGGNSLPPPPTTSLLSSSPATQAPAAVATTQPAAAVAGAVEVDALPNNAPAYVQLASQRSEAEARATAQAMVTRFGPLFGGANMEVQRVDLGAKGIYFRVRVPASSLQDANNICTNVKAAGGDCFTM